MKNRVNKVIDQFKDEDKLLFSDEVEKDALCAYESGDLDKLLRGEDVPHLTNKYLRKESLYRNEKK